MGSEYAYSDPIKLAVRRVRGSCAACRVLTDCRDPGFVLDGHVLQHQELRWVGSAADPVGKAVANCQAAVICSRGVGFAACSAGSSSSDISRMLAKALERGMPRKCVRNTKWVTPSSSM